MSWGLAGLLEYLLAPPGGLILLLILGLLFVRRVSGIILILFASVLLYASSIPYTANQLLALIEPPSQISTEELSAPRAQAIVVLGAGRREQAPEFNLPNKSGDTISASELERLRYAAWLAKQMKLPLLVSGGLADEDGPAEALMMKQALEQEFIVPVRWVEPDSRNTYENAKFSSQMLKADGINSIYLVTHAVHMPRSVWSFEQFKLQVIPAPTAYKGDPEAPLSVKSFLPDARVMADVSAVFHELVGMLWYRVRF